jgi:hypothetical protein
VARYDKYDGVAGGFRAESAAAVAEANWDRPIGASLNASGLLLVKAAGNSGFKGVTIVDRTKRKAGAILDTMTNGEIVDCAGLTAGTTYYLDPATGELTTVESRYHVGATVEAWRLVVRFSDQGAA